MCDNKIKQSVELALQNEELFDYTITVQGKSSKDDGYLGNITFVSVTGKTKNGHEKTMNLVVKSSKESTNLRKQVPVKDVFEKEIYIYNRVLPAFENFQKEKRMEEVLQVTPYCFASQITEKSEWLVLENLKPLNYRLWNRKIPMNFDHLKIVLETFGKWHGLSFALKKEKPETFKKLTKNNVNMFSEWFVQVKLIDYIWDNFEKSKKNLPTNHKIEALKKLNFSRNDVKYILTDLFFEEPEYHVILHGDCWTNNFLFKYEKNSTKPVDVRILDWQCSALGSPILDLSYFLYSCCSDKHFKNFNVLLEIYYESLSKELKKLGVDASEIYSYETLLKQWKRFSVYGIIISPFILRFSLCEAEEAPDLAEAAERGDNFLDSISFTLKNEDVYSDRIKHNLLHYLEYDEN